ncbi:MAG TPA: DUF4142 domain-containing protein [Urbifossiella sp.]
MMNKQVITFAAAAAIGCGGIFCGSVRAADTGGQIGSALQNGSARDENDQDRQAIQAANDPDKLFLVTAAINNRCEIQLAQLAQQQSQDQQVKDAAKHIQDDHTKALDQLQQTAKDCNCQLPEGTPALKRQEYQVLASLNGKDFDQAYICQMRAAHAMDIDKYQDVAQMAKNDKVKQFAQQQLPALEQHAQMVETAAVALGLPAANSAQTAGARINGDTGSSNGTSNYNSSNSTGTNSSQSR